MLQLVRMKISIFLCLVCLAIFVSSTTGFVVPDKLADVIGPFPRLDKNAKYECKVSHMKDILLVPFFHKTD